MFKYQISRLLSQSLSEMFFESTNNVEYEETLGFEPRQAKPTALAGQPVNHSGTFPLLSTTDLICEDRLERE